MKRRRMVASSVGGLLVLALLTMCVWSFWPAVGVDVSAADARLPGRLGDLPPGAIHVNYYLAGTFAPASYVEFDVEEEAFLRWARGRGWSPTRLSFRRPVWRPGVFISSEHPGETLEVQKGWAYEQWDPQNSDSGFIIVYDSVRHRAFYVVMTR